MSALKIDVLGELRIAHIGQPVERNFPPSVQGLISFLLLEGRSQHSRDAVAEALWSHLPSQQAQESLSAALMQTRSILEPKGVPHGTYLTPTSMDEIGFNWDSDHRIDVRKLEDAVDVARAIPAGDLLIRDIDVLGAALDTYRADLLPGLHHEWVLRERERVRLVYLTGLAISMYGLARAGNLERSIAFGRIILRHDPLREDIHRAMMRLFVASGQRALAIRQYQVCRTVLAEALDVEPMTETESLLKEVRRSAQRNGDRTAPVSMSDLERTLNRIGVGGRPA